MHLDDIKPDEASKYEVLVHTGTVMIRGEIQWLPLRKLQKPGARFGVHVSTSSGAMAFTRQEVLDVRLREKSVVTAIRDRRAQEDEHHRESGGVVYPLWAG